MKSSVKFGVVLPVYGQRLKWGSILSYAKAAEGLGYDSLWVSDHLLNPYLKERGVPNRFLLRPYALEVWTVLCALATATTKCRLGTYVLCNNFRHPSIVSKMATTLDIVSGGRVNLGIGACWFVEEFKSFGIPWKKYAVRLDMLKESIKLIKMLMTKNDVNFTGKYYNLQRANLEPKPVQKPHVPIWIGGNSKRILEIVAEMGNGWIPEGLAPKDLSKRVRFVRKKAKESGRDPNQITVAWGGGGARTVIAEDKGKVEEMAKSMAKAAGKPIKFLPWIIGTPDQCINKIKALVEVGAETIVAGFADFPSLGGLKLFSKSVIPHCKN